jgi:hypothetical protein
MTAYIPTREEADAVAEGRYVLFHYGPNCTVIETGDDSILLRDFLSKCRPRLYLKTLDGEEIE